MRLHTASEVISLMRRLENEGAESYELLSQFGQFEDDTKGFARENRRYVVQVQQAYNNVISDALEGGYAFDIEGDNYCPMSPENEGLREGLTTQIENERKISGLYLTAAGQAQSLLADVPRIFKQIAQKRKGRIEKLEALLKALS